MPVAVLLDGAQEDHLMPGLCYFLGCLELLIGLVHLGGGLDDSLRRCLATLKIALGFVVQLLPVPSTSLGEPLGDGQGSAT